MRKSRLWIYIASIISAAAIIVAVVLGTTGSLGGFGYKKSLKQGQEYLASGNYESAAESFIKARDIKPEDEEVWVGLADAYIGMEDYDNAKAALEMGLSYANTTGEINSRLQKLPVYRASGSDGNQMDIFFGWLEKLVSRSYADYEKKGEIERSTPGSDGSTVVRITGIPADVIYRTAITDNSLPTEIRFDDLTSVFGGQDQVTYQDFEHLYVDSLKIIDDTEFGSAVSFKAAGCEVILESDADGTVRSNAENRVVIKDVETNDEKNKKVFGVVLDAASNEGMSDVTMIFRKGSAESGDAEAEIKSGSDGDYEVELESGDYRVEFVPEEGESEFKDLSVPSLCADWEEDFVIAGAMVEGEARIVLNWGSQPSDLDSYLIGFNKTNNEDIFINYHNRLERDVADLDTDDQDGYGPETITIHDLNGTYEFSVIDFMRTGAFPDSEAKVTVYLPGQKPEEITFDPDGFSDENRVWRVLTIENGKLIEHNEWTTPSSQHEEW